MTVPNFEGLPFDLVLTHSITLQPIDTTDAEELIVSYYNVVAWGPNPYGTSTRGEQNHIIGTATTYEGADAIRTPAWNVIHIARRLRGLQ